MKYSGQTALITGASAGIGAEFARQLARRGTNLILVARRVERLSELREELLSSGVSVDVIGVDLGKRRALNRGDVGLIGRDDLADIIRTRQIDLLINNAGRGSYGAFEELDLAEELELSTLNIIAYQSLTHAVIPQMKARKSGAIVFVASVAAIQPLPLMSTYSATKAFDLIFSVGLHHELKPFGIRVLAVCPGPVETEFGQAAHVPNRPNSIPGASAAAVVRDSLMGLERNRAIVVPTMRARLLWAAGRLLPLNLRTAILARVMRT